MFGCQTTRFKVVDAYTSNAVQVFQTSGKINNGETHLSGITYFINFIRCHNDSVALPILYGLEVHRRLLSSVRGRRNVEDMPIALFFSIALDTSHPEGADGT